LVGCCVRVWPPTSRSSTTDTINPLPEDTVHDFPTSGWRIRELAQGIHYTIVHGQVLLEDGRHTGALPGRVLQNTLYHAPATA
jgi:N-acyl-D-aspartate/D-glutamate deacylase